MWVYSNARIFVCIYTIFSNKTTSSSAVHNYAPHIRNKNNVRCPDGSRRNNINSVKRVNIICLVAAEHDNN